MFVEFGVEHGRVHIRPRAGGFLCARFRGVRVVGGGQHGVRCLTHPGAVQADGRVKQHQCGHSVGMGGSQV